MPVPIPVHNAPRSARRRVDVFQFASLRDELETASDESTNRLKDMHGCAAKAGQLEAIRSLFERHDVLLSAKTGYGKSMILYSQSALKSDTIGLF